MTPGHSVSAADRALLDRFLMGDLPPAQFHHREHLRLAYTFLILHGPESATDALRSALQGFLRHHGIDPAKYHETMTRAWMLAVVHFMQITPAQPNADAFLDAQPRLLDPQIMLTHYSKDSIRSDQARVEFVEPDLDPIPRYLA